MRQLHLSKTIITNDKEPITNGGLLIEGEKLLEVGAKSDFGDFEGEVIDHGESLICPGFINLHTHLAYTDAKGISGENGLFPWIINLITKTSSWSSEDYTNSTKNGLDKLLSSGTTFAVENTPHIDTIETIANSPIKSLIGIEVFGSDEEASQETFKNQLNALQALVKEYSSNKTNFTLSPHAPYDVSLPLWKKIISWSTNNNKKILTHIEESTEEKRWWAKRESSATKLWKKLNVYEPKEKYWKKHNSSIDFLNKNNLLNNNLIATHLCEASIEELKILKNNEVSIVHSPRSNFYLKNKMVDLRIWDDIGLNWGIGTDSLASNHDLNILEELRFALKYQEEKFNYKINCKKALKKITSDSAEIIGLGNSIGTLKSGFYADFLVYNLSRKNDYTDPYKALIWEIDTNNDLKKIIINGKITPCFAPNMIKKKN